jgi:UDP-N-acetylglucosamine:LPS N-acetylglucosamine transferase
MSDKVPKVLAISSGGGHWVQLLRLQPAFQGCDLVFATVDDGYRADVGEADFRVVPDSNFSDKFALIKTAVAVFRLLRNVRPDVIVSTGAAPGFFAVRLGKLLGSRTIWIDSIANSEELSMSGRRAGFVDLWLTQWPNLASDGGPKYCGNVL